MFTTKNIFALALFALAIGATGAAPTTATTEMSSASGNCPAHTGSTAEHMFGPVLLACTAMLSMSAIAICLASEGFVANAERLIKVWRQHQSPKCSSCQRQLDSSRGRGAGRGSLASRILAAIKGFVAPRLGDAAASDVEAQAHEAQAQTQGQQEQALAPAPQPESAYKPCDDATPGDDDDDDDDDNNNDNNRNNRNDKEATDDKEALEDESLIVGQEELASPSVPLDDGSVYGQLNQGASPLGRLTRKLSSRFGNFSLTALKTQASRYSLRSIQEEPEEDETFETALEQSYDFDDSDDATMVKLSPSSSISSSPSPWSSGEIHKVQAQYCSSPLGAASLSASPSRSAGSGSSSSSSSPSPSPLRMMTERLTSGSGWTQATPCTLTTRPPRPRGARPQPYPYMERPPPVPPKDVVVSRPQSTLRPLSQRDHDEALHRAVVAMHRRQASRGWHA